MNYQPIPTANSDGNGMIPTANIAGGACRQDETAVESIAPAHVAKKPTENGNVKGCVSPTNTKPNTSLTTAVATCAHCGGEMVVKRPSKRFCGAVCRRAAWLVRNPDKMAALAISDKARLHAHLESRGIVWIEQVA